MTDCYLVLSLDGGGVRGAYQARILERLEAAVPFLHKVKLVAGSSIGGINAMALARGVTPSELVDLYKDHTTDIFSKRDWWDSIAGGADEVFRADYDNDGLRDVLEDYFGGRTIGELDKRVLVTSFDLDNWDGDSGNPPKNRFWKAKIFHNYPGSGSDSDQLAVDVGLRTAAAPTVFPSHQGYVDGGMVANNPSMCAYGQAIAAGVAHESIALLSVGTGCNPTHIEGDRLDWGLKQWASYILPMFLDGMVGLPDYICRQILSQRYARVCPYLPEAIDIDAADRVDDLLEWANEVDLSAALDLITALPE